MVVSTEFLMRMNGASLSVIFDRRPMQYQLHRRALLHPRLHGSGKSTWSEIGAWKTWPTAKVQFVPHDQLVRSQSDVVFLTFAIERFGK